MDAFKTVPTTASIYVVKELLSQCASEVRVYVCVYICICVYICVCVCMYVCMYVCSQGALEPVCI